MARARRFNFKELDVYRAAMEHFVWVMALVGDLERPPFALVNQILAAALSILANIAEANGRAKQPGEAEQHYRYAQGSVYECAAHLDALMALGAIDRQTFDTREEHLDRIAAMLARLVQKQARLRRRRGGNRSEFRNRQDTAE